MRSRGAAIILAVVSFALGAATVRLYDGYARGREAVSHPVPSWQRQWVFMGEYREQRHFTAWLLRGWEDERSMGEELRLAAYDYWKDSGTATDDGRREALRYLKEIGKDPTLIRDLELTVAPRPSKPGTPEALIDDLTQYYSSEYALATTAGVSSPIASR